MIQTSVILVALVSHFLAVISPGPDFVVAVRNSLIYSRKTGIYTALGFAFGIGVHLLYGIFGLTLILQQSTLVFSVVKYFGAIYLLYLGISILRTHNQFRVEQYKSDKQDISIGKAILSGFLTNVLNPKASLFFLSLLTYVLKSNPTRITLIISSMLMMCNTFLWFSFVALFFNMDKIRKFYEHYQYYFMKGLSLVLMALAVFMVVYKNQ